ncbi:MAG: hypothetical protein ACKO8O_15095 [Betaproteobacteria bacterium]
MPAVLNRRSLLAASATLVLPGSMLSASGAHAADAERMRSTDALPRFSFALIGDLPYRRFELAAVPWLLEDIAQQCAFAIHVGDIKGGSELCSNELLEARIAALSATRVPMVYTPGDNEWTDCWRPAAGDHDPSERLDWLRRAVFERSAPWLGPTDQAARRALQGHATGDLAPGGPDSFATDRLVRQRDIDSGPPENLMWIAGNVLFLTLNLPGSDNGRRSPLDDADRFERDAHNRRWLERALAVATSARLVAIAVAAHANPGFGRGIDPSKIVGDDGYAAFRHDLARLNARFSGHLLLMHGDTHRFRVDRILPRLTRVECFGSPFTSSWVRIDVHPQRSQPFEISVRNASAPRDESTP